MLSKLRSTPKLEIIKVKEILLERLLIAKKYCGEGVWGCVHREEILILL